MIELARQFGRYGYRRIAALLREAGWSPLGSMLRMRLPGNGLVMVVSNGYGGERG